MPAKKSAVPSGSLSTEGHSAGYDAADLAPVAGARRSDSGAVARRAASRDGVGGRPHARIFQLASDASDDPILKTGSWGCPLRKMNAPCVSLATGRVGSKAIYTYDFGDSWEHSIVLEKRLPIDPNTPYPVCTDGQLACPPEDCGGIPGFYDLIEVLSDARISSKQAPELATDLVLTGKFYNDEYVQLMYRNEDRLRRQLGVAVLRLDPLGVNLIVHYAGYSPTRNTFVMGRLDLKRQKEAVAPPFILDPGPLPV